MNRVRIRADYGGTDYIAEDVQKIEVVEQMEGDPAFATLRIYYSDPDEHPDDYEELSEAFIEEVVSIPQNEQRDQFRIKLADSHTDDDIAACAEITGIEYCRRHYPNDGMSFQISAIGETKAHAFEERQIGEFEYNEIVGVEVA